VFSIAVNGAGLVAKYTAAAAAASASTRTVLSFFFTAIEEYFEG
jgi:hypothetical protein